MISTRRFYAARCAALVPTARADAAAASSDRYFAGDMIDAGDKPAMITDLLERAAALQRLASLLAELRAGAGRTAVVSGEAGVGKTSLLEHFARGQTRQVL
jgi:MoxR-like ATPase